MTAFNNGSIWTE